VRIGIVNERVRETDVLRSAVARTPEHQVVWIAKTGAEAVKQCARETPDLVLMDLFMAGMDGVEATRRIMASTPCAILIVTGSVHAGAARVFEAMGHGALDAVDMPGSQLLDSGAPLLEKISVISRLLGEKDAARSAPAPSHDASPVRQHRLVVIGASAGGPAALAVVLRGIPKEFPAAIVVIQHVDAQFAVGMADWLGRQCVLPVMVAREGERTAVGCVLLAGTSDHLAMKSADRVGYTEEPRQYAYRPSVDVFFQSVSRQWRGDLVGVLLTGMGNDGALGLKALRDRGHHTIAQDQATSAVYGMPKAAAALNAAVDILPMERIASRLIEVVSWQSHHGVYSRTLARTP
jgi:two-component system, chemotaxis family, response regulator WspF